MVLCASGYALDSWLLSTLLLLFSLSFFHVPCKICQHMAVIRIAILLALFVVVVLPCFQSENQHEILGCSRFY